MKKQDFKVLKTKDLYPFPDNPFYSWVYYGKSTER